jgi:hypothetical protein
MSEGVPLNQLRCPTCGDRYEDFNMHSDEREGFEMMIDPIKSAIMPTPWFILCPNGHKWTVKTLWRAVNHHDRVQLDRYLGTA